MRVTIEVNSLQKLMVAAGLTSNELADLLMVDASLVSRKINGHRKFYTEEIALLHENLKARGVTISKKKLWELVGNNTMNAPESVRRYFLLEG